MRKFTEKIVPDIPGDDVFIDRSTAGHPMANECPDCVVSANGGREDSAVEIDPKLARKEAVNDMKKAHIMDAAIKVIARDGIANVRLEDVAEEAGFSKASLYHYFPDKEALFIHIALREQRAEYEKCVEMLGRGLSFLETIKEFVTIVYNNQGGMISGGGVSQDGMCTIAASMSNILLTMSKHEELMDEAITYKINTNNLLRGVISKARAAGILNIALNDTAVCTMITSFIHSSVMGRAYRGLVKNELASAELDKIDINWVVNAIFVFLEPWVKDNNPHRRWYDV